MFGTKSFNDLTHIQAMSTCQVSSVSEARAKTSDVMEANLLHRCENEWPDSSWFFQRTSTNLIPSIGRLLKVPKVSCLAQRCSSSSTSQPKFVMEGTSGTAWGRDRPGATLSGKNERFGTLGWRLDYRFDDWWLIWSLMKFSKCM